MVQILEIYATNSKFLGQNFVQQQEDRRRRPFNNGGAANNNPCNFSGNRPNKGQGRTFFDLQYFNVEHNYNLNINCGGSPMQHQQQLLDQEILQNNNKPPLGGQGGGHHHHNKPLHHQKPSGGGLFGGNHGGGLFGGTRPQQHHHNRPFQGILNGINQQPNESGGDRPNNPGIFSGAFAGILPSPQQFATGLSGGLQSFIETIPAIGQSFQSILPSFGDFQPFNPAGLGFRPPSVPTGRPPILQPSTSTVNPDEIIYNDDGIRPISENYDPITDSVNRRTYGLQHRFYGISGRNLEDGKKTPNRNFKFPVS